MNFLGHLHLAHKSQSSLLGNLLGDFVRGNPEGRFEPAITHGIRMHRFIDSFTDSHPAIVAIKPLFGERRRFSPIALDVFWDHCLTQHWRHFHPHSLAQFCHNAQSQTHPKWVHTSLPERYQYVISAMWDGGWIFSYQELENIEFVLKRMSKRSERMAPLAECFATLETHYQTLNQVFLDFYPDVIEAVTHVKLK
ncbi:ACP phosphodiesterase [Vibrio ezurae]|uniref:Acyl carrier protein phosphodiesterase n=1 Tax=Vibrio ezurae NBRC 102218 TaxID=1219080 RepID=U3CPK1_9VIBR|nr:ACP phosphodiesterase [Vibrio ezurae]GAD80073.1 acyl carrier protein phosphodiesterase [Vibrio ezurae NBRC 102218]